MSKVRLKQLAQDGAVNGQAVVWNNATSRWEPSTTGSVANPRLRATATLQADVAAGVVLVGPGGDSAQNLSANLLDYTAFTFEQAVELDINGRGKVPAAGATADVYAAVTALDKTAGGFRSTVDLKSGDIVQMFIGAGADGADGIQGPAGADGADGAPGPIASLTAGTLLEKTGTPSDPIVSVASQADSGVMIYDANGAPVYLGPGADNLPLLAKGAGVAPTFAKLPVGSIDPSTGLDGQHIEHVGGVAAWKDKPTGGGGAVLPFEQFTRTQSADGGGAPAGGKFNISSGSSATPSGITKFRFAEWNTGFAQNQEALLDTFGTGNILKIVKAGAASEWAYYKLNFMSDAGLYRFFEVTYVLHSSGFTFDETSDYYFSTYYSGQVVSEVAAMNWTVSLPANNTDFITHNATRGFFDNAADDNVGSGIALDYTNKGLHFGGTGTIMGWKFAGYTPSVSGWIQVRPAVISKSAGVAVGTALTPAYPHGLAESLKLATVNQWEEYSQFNLTLNKNFVSGDELIVLFKNSSSTARTVYVQGAIYYMTVSLG